MNNDDELKPFWKTTEFHSLMVVLCGALVESSREFNAVVIMGAITLVGSGYILARSLFKRNRQILKYSAVKTSEFYVFITTALTTIGISQSSGDGNAGIVMVAIEYLIYCIGRGMVKGVNKESTTVQLVS
jgi:hypothetical protein